jgi:pantoate--beta-alanine ligase
MKVITAVSGMRDEARRLKAEGFSIGFVPTMGYLHEGHLSLVRAAGQGAAIVVVSIFVNPTQFGPAEDLSTYPRDFARDAAMLEKEDVDILFCPDRAEMYPPGYKTYIEVQDLQNKLCGRSRPDHFQGVCTVVAKFFEIIAPDIAYFGQKDAQQAIILERMTRDLNLSVRIEVRPIVREPDGLAMSSRNTYLNPAQRRAAAILFRSLQEAKTMIAAGERRAGVVVSRITELLGREPLARIDYVEAVDPDALDPVDAIGDGTLLAVAVNFGRTRLIDNWTVRL